MEPMATIDVIKFNTAKGKSIEECSYNNFIDIACHVAVKAIIDKYHKGVIPANETVKEYTELKKWYEHFSRAYTAERELYEKQGQSMTKALTMLNRVNIARTEKAALNGSIEVLRTVFGDKTIGSRYYNKE